MKSVVDVDKNELAIASLIGAIATSSPFSKAHVRIHTAINGSRVYFDDQAFDSLFTGYDKWQVVYLPELKLNDFFNPEKFQKSLLLNHLKNYNLLELTEHLLYIDIRGKNLSFCATVIKGVEPYFSNNCPFYLIPNVDFDETPCTMIFHPANQFFKYIVKENVKEQLI